MALPPSCLGGRIATIGSIAALLGLTRCVALEGAPHGVTCVMVSPTWVETGPLCRTVAQLVEREGAGRLPAEAMRGIARRNPRNRIIQPGEIASPVAFLRGEKARGITMENIQVAGGALWWEGLSAPRSRPSAPL